MSSQCLLGPKDKELGTDTFQQAVAHSSCSGPPPPCDKAVARTSPVAFPLCCLIDSDNLFIRIGLLCYADKHPALWFPVIELVLSRGLC